jgi:two-component system, NtrC family, response regulator AtoC
MAKHRVLVIDDDELMREYVEEAMVRAGYAVEAFSNGAAGLAAFDAAPQDIVITDLKMTPMDGIEVVHRIHKIAPASPVIVMTAYGTIETAVSALKEGAVDYILKPFTPDVLEMAVNRALEVVRLSQENQYLRRALADAGGFKELIGASAAMAEVHEQIHKVADSRATLLIRGESGTGKELVARAIHEGGSRAQKPFIRVNCAALSAGILESELFGHERGAFTGAHERKVGRFELADGGSLLLDEISEIGIELQSKLLRALQEREFERVGGTQTIAVDTRIMATSNRDLEDAVRQGKFREDLFFRLNVIPIQLPSLRQRKEDIPDLAMHFLMRFNQENGRAITGFSDPAMAALTAYDWPGNVRELQNAIERAVVLTAEDTLAPQHFSLDDTALSSKQSAFAPGSTVAEMEKQLILDTLDHCKQNRTRASEVLGISVRTLRNKLKEYGLSSTQVTNG